MVAVIILAAGESRRLGIPKQLLIYRGRSLITRSVTAAVESRCDGVIVVLGAYADSITAEIESLPVKIAWNPEWQEGKSTTIQAGIRALLSSPTPLDATIVMTCDQPHVDSDLINAILDRHYLWPESIVACEYSGTLGVPALIPQKYFEELMRLTGDEGAKVLIAAHPEAVQRIDFPEGAIDIDTLPDLGKL